MYTAGIISLACHGKAGDVAVGKIYLLHLNKGGWGSPYCLHNVKVLSLSLSEISEGGEGFCSLPDVQKQGRSDSPTS